MALLAGGLAAALPAQTPAWFPLEVGNTWLYRAVPAGTRRLSLDPGRISVDGTETINGREYFDVSYFGRAVLLRVEPSTGEVIVYDRASSAEQTWASLGLPAGSTFQTAISPCATSATIVARDAAVTVPAGSFSNAVQLSFRGNCVDVGVQQQFYAPYVGLVRDEEETIFGLVEYELIYYRAGRHTSSAPEVSFTVALDSARYAPGSNLGARLTLRNTTASTIPLHFYSGQTYEMKILDENGRVVASWSAARTFAMIVRDETLGPGERTYGLTMPLTNLPNGRYIAQAFLTTDPLLYLGQVAFEIGPL